MPALPPNEILSSYRRDTWERPSRWEYLEQLQSYRNGTQGTSADDNTVHPTYNEDLPRPPGPRVFYEELISLGLDYTFDRLVGTIRIRQPVGYGGGLCSSGGLEYVSFWADWNDTCKWTYLGTQTIPVHNIPEIPPDGLTYSAIQPVDLRWEKALCNTTKIARVLAAVSFGTPPPEPPLVALRGNFLERHVQLQPISTISTVGGLIESIGGVLVTEIEVKTTGKTSPGATFKDPPFSFTDPLQLGRGSPFGGNIIITGPPIGIGQYYYRVMVRNFGSSSAGSPVTIRQYIDNSGLPKTVTEAASDTEGYFQYIVNPNQNPDKILADWQTNTLMDGLWQIQLEVATLTSTGYNSEVLSPWYNVLVNNVYPIGDIYPTSGSNCGDFGIGTPIKGNFWFTAQYLAFWSFGIPSGFTITPPGVNSYPVPGPPGSPWTMIPNNIPCGYVTWLQVQDLTILNSLYYPPMAINLPFSFCLRRS